MINVQIDELTPCLKDVRTGEFVQTEVIMEVYDYEWTDEEI